MVDDERDGVRLTNLDAPLGDGLEVTKGDLVDHLDANAARLVPQLAGRPLSVKRVRPGQEPFMQYFGATPGLCQPRECQACPSRTRLRLHVLARGSGLLCAFTSAACVSPSLATAHPVARPAELTTIAPG